MTNKHTNTIMPWDYRENITSFSVYVKDKSRTRGETLIATVPKSGRMSPYAKKNAAIISASIEMFLALESALGQLNNDTSNDQYGIDVRNRVRAALAKARGEL